MILIVYALIGSGVLYMILQNIDDTRNKNKGHPVASNGRRIALFFFLFVVVLILLHFMGVGTGKSMGGGNENNEMSVKGGSSYKIEMIKNINEDVDVGLPPF